MAFDAGTIEARATLDKSSFLASLQEIKAEAAKGIQVPLKFDTSQAGLAASVASAKAAIQAMLGKGVTIPLTFDTSNASIAQTVATANAAIKAAMAAAGGIKIPLVFDTSPAAIAATIATAKAAAKAAVGAGIVIPVRFAPVGVPGAPGGGSQGGGGGGGPVIVPPPPTGGGGGGGGGGGWGWLGGTTSLWFGAATIGNMTLAVHLLFEFAAAIGPALIALGAFGIAAAGVFGDIKNQLTNMNTVVQATGRNMYPFTSSLSRLQDAIRPQVYQLFGDALQIINQRSGVFAYLAKGAATVLDQLGIRFVDAVTKGNGFGTLVHNAIPDLAKWGDIIGNLGAAFGHLLTQMPGIAQVFLNILDAGSKVVEWATYAITPILRLGLAMHGLFLYGGLAATGLTLIYRSATTQGGLINNLATGFVLAGTKVFAFGQSLFNTAKESLYLAKNASIAEGATRAWAGTLGMIPGWGWAAAGVIALGALIIYILRAKDATQQWIDQLNQGLARVPLDTALNRMSIAASEVSTRMADAKTHLDAVTAASEQTGSAAAGAGNRFNTLATTVIKATADYQALHGEQTTLTADQATFKTHVDALSIAYDGQGKALALLKLAGVSTGEVMSRNKNTWDNVKTAVQSTYDGYRAMGIQSGVLGTDLRALNVVTSDQYTSMQKLNQALDAYVSITSSIGGNNATVIQSFRQLKNELAVTGASFTGTNTASIALQNTFYNQLIPQTQQMLDTMRQAGYPTKDLAHYFATLLNPAVHNGALESNIARDAIYKMAQEAGYHGVNSIKALKGWIDQYRESLSKIPQNVLSNVKLSGSGSFTVQPIPIGGGNFIRPAAGAYVTQGSTPTADDVPAMVSKGELIVPTHMVNAGLVDHLRGAIPGFASGGIVPGYAGTVPGIMPWYDSDETSTIYDVALGLERDFQLAVKKMQQQYSSQGGGSGGPAPMPGGGAPAANAALARRMYPPWASGANWAAWNYVAMAESGWSNIAYNPSGAFGIPQALPYTKMPKGAWPTWAGGSANPGEQISWMIGYIKSVYGTPEAAAAHEASYHWYDNGGWLPPGLSIALNGTGRPEPVGFGTPGAAPMPSQGPLIGAVSFNYSDSGDVHDSMADLLFTMRHARQTGFGGVPL